MSSHQLKSNEFQSILGCS